MENQMITKILVLFIFGLLIVIFAKKNEKFKAVATGKIFKIVAVVIGKIFKIVVVAVLVVLVLTALSFNVFADEIKVKDIQELGVVSAKDYEVKSTPIEYSLKDSLEKGNVFDARNFTKVKKFVKSLEGLDFTDDLSVVELKLKDIPELGFAFLGFDISNIYAKEAIETVEAVVKENNSSHSNKDMNFTAIDFRKKLDVTVNGENLKLEEIIYDKKENTLIPIYSPKNNFERAIEVDFEHKADFLTVVDRYPASINEIYCKFVESYGNSCIEFDGLECDKAPFSDFNFIRYYIGTDFRIGTSYKVLKERWGINDDFIKYKLEPYRMWGMPNQEWMWWDYTYYK